MEVLPSNLPSRVAQPGWAYVPDTGPIAAIQPGQRKRGRDDNAFGGSSAKQLKAIEQRLKDLDKENYKDVPIPIPKGDRDRKGRKMTSNVRRILGYSRNFGHYLADEEALIAAGGAPLLLLLWWLWLGPAVRRKMGRGEVIRRLPRLRQGGRQDN